MTTSTMDKLLAVKAAAIAERNAAFALTDAENELASRVREALASGADVDYVVLAAKASISIGAEQVAKAKRAK